MSRIGFNVEWAVVKNRALGMQRLAQLRPNWCITFSANDANEMRANGVGNVTVRRYPDRGVVENLSPDQWMIRYEGIRAAGHWCEYTNEAGLQTKKLLELIPLALKNGFRMTIPGLATGTPEASDWNAWNQILDWAVENPSQLVVSFHDYFAGYAIMGMGSVKTVEQGRQWTPDSPVPDGPLYLVGRTPYYLKKHQDARGKPMPRLICTEGPSVGNVGNYEGTFITTKPWPITWGWQSMLNEYAANPTLRQWSPGRGYAKQIIWADKNVYKPYGVEGVMPYCYGADSTRQPGSESDWGPFDYELFPEFFEELLSYANSETGFPPPVTPPIVIIGDQMSDYTLHANAGQTEANLRAGYSTSAPIVSVIPDGATVQVVATPQVTDDAGQYVWQQVTYNGVTGWLAVRGVSAASSGYVIMLGALPVTVVAPAITITLPGASDAQATYIAAAVKSLLDIGTGLPHVPFTVTKN